MLEVGLRVDVDTYRGTRFGVPALVDLFERFDRRATFFMSVGPDNMGRHLWRLLKPRFLYKMLRSNAASLYGWDILLRGTFWPGPRIGAALADQVRLPHRAGHEVGLHAWDHHSWQINIDRFSAEQMREHLRRGYDTLAELLGTAPTCSAAAGWRCNQAALLMKETFHFRYNSDCRGTGIFRPVVDGRRLAPQIPVTLPTYDEVIGGNGINDDNYNHYILDQFKPDQLNVYTIHAEVEGIARREQFERLLTLARERGVLFRPLGELLDRCDIEALPDAPLGRQTLPGREGWLAWQGEAA